MSVTLSIANQDGTPWDCPMGQLPIGEVRFWGEDPFPLAPDAVTSKWRGEVSIECRLPVGGTDPVGTLPEPPLYLGLLAITLFVVALILIGKVKP